MKKVKILSYFFVFMTVILTGCSQGKQIPLNYNDQRKVAESENIEFEIGVLVGSGGLADQGLNQAAWEGVVQFAERYPYVGAQHVVVKNDEPEAYLQAMDDLMEAGVDIVIALGPEWSDAVANMQTKKEEISFILVDGELDQVHNNVVHLNFAEEEAGFLVGVAAALQSQTEKVGFIGGKDINSIQRYGWGYMAGVAYANQKFDRDIVVSQYEYLNTLHDIQQGQKKAKEMFREGVDIIFAPASTTGIGVMNETKAFVERDEHVFFIGADRDQFDDGKVINDRSVVLTSAVKKIEVKLYELLNAYGNHDLPGGETLKQNIANGGVSLPEKNPNFTEEVRKKVDEVFEELKEGKLEVPQTMEELMKYLDEFGYKANKSL